MLTNQLTIRRGLLLGGIVALGAGLLVADKAQVREGTATGRGSAAEHGTAAEGMPRTAEDVGLAEAHYQPRYLTLNPGQVVDLSFLSGGEEPAALRQSPELLQGTGDAWQFRAEEPGYGVVTAGRGGQARSAFLFVSPVPSMQLDREDLDWYRTQFGTGVGNCGPATVSMAILWASGVDVPVEQIRAEIGYPYVNGATSLEDLEQSMNSHGVRTRRPVVSSAQELTRIIERGHLALVLIRTGGIERAQRDPRTDLFGRYYDEDEGHYLLVKGYSLDGRYFVVYDPFPSDWKSNGLRYADGTSMIGKNRYYPAAQLSRALGTSSVLEILP